MTHIDQGLYVDAALTIAGAASDVANYCDHVEHNEIANLEAVRRAGCEFRMLAVKLSLDAAHDPIDLYADRLGVIETRNVLWHEDAFDGPAMARSASTWRGLQLVQAMHDKAYHADVIGLAKADQLRHYALHASKLAGATAAVARGTADSEDWLVRRVPDMLLFGLKLSTVTGEKLSDELVPRRRSVTDRPPREVGAGIAM